jgi:RNA polymerase sigma-70 factor (ECF subfamily)
MTEEEIIDHLADPNKRSAVFSQLVRMYQERIYWHIRKMVLSHEDSNDVMQNVFMKAWNAIDQFRGEAKLSSWLYRIATNESITFLTQQKNKASSSMDEESFLLNQLHSDEYFDGNEAELKLQEAILTLPDKQRLVFNMKYFDNLTYEQMEAILETSVGALKASYHHAVKKIEKKLIESIDD